MTVWNPAVKSIILPPDAGDPLVVFGNPFLLKVSGAASHGSMAFLTGSFAPGTGAVPHLHRGHDEIFYVLSGTFRFRLGDEESEHGAGAMLFAPRHAPHGFQNIGESDGQLLGVVAPAGYEQHFVEISGLMPGRDSEKLAEIFGKFDQEPA